MKKVVLLITVILGMINHIKAQSVIVNPDGTHAVVIDNGASQTIVNSDETHSTAVGNVIVNANGTHSVIVGGGETKTIINANGSYSILIDNGLVDKTGNQDWFKDHITCRADCFTGDSINWDLFKGVLKNDSLAASISTSIQLEVIKTNIWNGSMLFKGYATMNSQESWVSANYKNDDTLQHEQTHFNITALCARGLAEELNQKKIKSNKSPLVKATFSKWQTKMESWQKQYDLETKGGNLIDAQNFWNKKISDELNKALKL